jgi:predicted MPP superfamily phosphohydrolase
LALGLAVAVGALTAGLAYGHLWMAPEPWDLAAVAWHRFSQMVALPAVALVSAIDRPPAHAWPNPHLFLSSLLTPLLYYGMWRLILRRRKSMDRAIADAAPENQPRLSRRLLLTRAAGATLAAGLGGVGAWAVGGEPALLTVRRYSMPIAGLPPSLEGLRIVQVSDTHYGPFISQAFLRRVVRAANALRPDLIALTGDYVHRTPRAIEPGIGLLGELRAPLGRVAVLGNHDHWEGAAACRDIFRRIGIPLIDNDRLYLTREGLSATLGDPAETLCIAGLGDLWTDLLRPAAAFRDTPEAMPRIVLSHNPDSAEELGDDWRIDLMLSGHTHGGQVRFPVVGAMITPSAFGQKYAGGVCSSPAGPVVVSRGIGMAVLPVRLGVPPELVEVTLRRA